LAFERKVKTNREIVLTQKVKGLLWERKLKVNLIAWIVIILLDGARFLEARNGREM
jgi:hypothetical protein